MTKISDMRFFFVFSIILYSCSNSSQSVKEFIDIENLPIEEIKGAEMLHTHNGFLRVKVIANTIKRFRDVQPSLIFSDGLEVVFYNDSGKVQSVLTAESAKIDETNNIMIASGNVVLISSENKKLESEELVWDEVKNKIHTNKNIVVTTGREVVEGKGFQSNPDFSEYSISKIQGVFNFTAEIK